MRQWWSRRWLQTMQAVGAVKKISRGRACAKEGHVLSCDFTPGRVAARVQGSQQLPWEVRFMVDAFDELQWKRVLDVLSRRPVHAARLLAGEMPADLEGVFEEAGLSVLPHRGVAATCTCPSEEASCKHVAAVCYVVADALEEDPFLLFTLRGRTRVQVLGALRGGASPGLPSDPSLFYAMPSLDGFDVDLACPPSDVAVARLGAPWPSFGEALAPAYDVVARQAARVIGRS